MHIVVEAVVRRGVRLGIRMGAVPAVLSGSIWLGVAVMWLFQGRHRGAPPALGPIAIMVGGSLGVGVLVGAAIGTALALSPEWLAARAPLRGALAGLVAGTTYLGQTVVVAVATDVGYGPVLLTLVSTPVVAVVAAVRGGDILGRAQCCDRTGSPGGRRRQTR
ncbi:hypothetical protein [Kitasatospora sp. NPDC004531]